ncbi:MAG: hypothetical protein IJJ52_03155, partial [Lachnospiraceae bacterium]|nr:hypothetical protein [Lachnospiraceae bacterium]
VKAIIHEKSGCEQVAFRLQAQHLAYKTGVWRTKLAFRLQICSFQFTNKNLALQTGTSDYNSAQGLLTVKDFYIKIKISYELMQISYDVSRRTLTLHIDKCKIRPSDTDALPRKYNQH